MTDELTLHVKPFLEDLRKIAYTYKRPELPPSRKISRFEKLMNKFGWYRQTELIVIESDKLFSLDLARHTLQATGRWPRI